MKTAKALMTTFLMATCSMAQAAPISYYLSGVFDDPLQAGSNLLGTAFTASFDYDPAGASLFTPPTPTFSQHLLPMPNSWVVNVQGGTLSNVGSPYLSGVHIRLTQGLGDELIVIGSAPTGTGVLANYNLINLYQTLKTDSTDLDSLSLPANLFSLGDPDLIEFMLGIFQLDASFNTVGFAMGNVTCFSTDPQACRGTSVPEPGALGLLALGLIGLAGSRRRKSAVTDIS